MKKILIRADASTTIGTGHVMRCLTLATALKKSGCEILFLCKDLKGNMAETIKKNGFQADLLPVDYKNANQFPSTMSIWTVADQRKDFDDCLGSIGNFKPDMIIIDHYSLDQNWHNLAREYVKNIFVIDDLADRNHDCDFLLDQTFGINGKRYKDLVPENCVLFMGSQYALLREDFASKHQAALKKRKQRKSIETVLISFGGSDPDNISLIALRACEMLYPPKKISVDLVIGPSNQNQAELKNFIDKSPLDVRLHINTNKMADLMISADLALGAGGTTTWERCCLALPSIVVCLADNQRDTINALEKKGAIINAGNAESLSANKLSGMIYDLLDNPLRINDLRKISGEICDGTGAEKIVSSLKSKMVI
ncbi:MAG: UDP-2,4-diacetamido-2,4,6-trideoxy-beta-L-altropyranose hydrolase [Alphaproteobacteria bacterium]|nr:UDP-2,4-diacetamido-2,4,6-trideoxy-beta-L-altropyranose hydrolase [Alphaproteobacteria bacterium]HPF47932.1 UDP-2,4-diacetamido-2,4,6-trideoxy-beta-L-altropyranose hydrolase [Emcibacteraceae bacterium]HRW29510.1 UDP-2,4-diacetamido-2,4,6-trideoxy-beta-L-altropyranose hydrolase [Emcibacteraceae bacterium]